MKQLKHIKLLILGNLFFILLMSFGRAAAQSGSGGVNSLFTEAGVGARALSLGGAFVALSDDPTAVYWNPAGLDFIEKKGVSFFYSSLDFGTTYNFIGGVYPTTSIGSFGFGWLRIGTDDIPERGSTPTLISTADMGLNQWFFSYAKQVRSTLSLGLNFKIERTSFSFADNTADTGIGADVGVMYRPQFDNEILSNLSFGLNFQNIIKPRARLVDTSVSTPINFKAGLSKLFTFGGDARSAFRLLFDFNKSENGDGTMHFGTEYSFQENANVRIGMDDGQAAFGAGAAYNNFHFDYNYGKFGDGEAFSASHRFTITVEIGKGKTELIRLAQERRERELRLQIENQLWFTSETDFHTRMEEGRGKYYEKDFLGSYAAFQSAFDAASNLVEISMRLRGENTDDPEANMRVETANSSVQEAQTMLDLANTKSDSVRQEDRKRIILDARQTVIEQELQDFIIEHREKGIALFKSSQFSRAIAEWHLALDRITRAEADLQQIPDWVLDVKQQLENDIGTAESQLEGNIKESIQRADALARRGQYVEALEELNQIRSTGLTESERKTIESKIGLLQRQLSFEENYDKGVRQYAAKQWKQAMDSFERALQVKPNDSKAKKYYEDAKARSLATAQQLPQNLRIKYIRGRTLYREGKYQEAIDVYEQILLEQPYNKTVLDAIDSAHEKLEE